MTPLGKTQVKTPPVVVSDNDRLKQPLAAEVAVINSFRCVKQAEYRHGDRNHCLKGNFGRNSILDPRLYQVPCLLVERLAGTGKSTIEQTSAEKLFAGGRLRASFFCSRDLKDRSDLKFILQTLMVQLARGYAEF